MQDKLRDIFNRTFGLQLTEIKAEWGQNDIEGWDSLGHMNLVSALEEEFKISLEIDEVIAMENVAAIEEVLKQKNI